MNSQLAISCCHLKQLRHSSGSGSSSIMERMRWMDVSREWWAKTPAHVLRLAGTLSYLTWAWVGGAEPERIEVEFVQAAVRLVRDYFWPHSRAALRQIGLNERHASARRVLKWIKADKRRNKISREDLRRDALGQSLDLPTRRKT